MFKPVSKSLLGFLVAQLIFPCLAIAASAPESVTPSNAFTYIELNTGVDHPLKGKIAELFENAIAAEGDATEQETAIANILLPYLDNTTIGYSQSYNKSTLADINFISVALPEDAFQNLVAASPELTETNLGYNKIIYGTGGDFFFSYKNGFLVGADVKGIISDLMMQDRPSTMSGNTNYQLFKSQASSASFLKGFINFANLPAELRTTGSPTEWLQSEGFAFNQTSTGIDGIFLVTPTAAAGMNPSTYTFVPALHQNINPTNLLLYSEAFNLTDHGQDGLKVLGNEGADIQSLLTEMSTGLAEETGLDFATEIGPLFKNRTAFAMHSEWDNQYLPGFSLVTEVKDQALAQKSIGKFKASITKSMDDSETKYTLTSIKTSAGDFDQTTMSLDGDIDNTDPKNIFSLSIGVTPGGLMVITTLTKPEQLFRASGLSTDTEWSSQFVQEPLIDLSFVNFMNLQTYILALTEKFEAPEDVITGINKVMSPLKSVYLWSKPAENSFLGKFKLHLDKDKIDEAVQYLQSLDWADMFGLGRDLGDDFNESIDSFQENLGVSSFDDVPAGSWFSRAVANMAFHQIMNGYGNLFRPNQPITRAEFIKTLITAEENVLFQEYSAFTVGENFNDVAGDAWYFRYIQMARANNFVNGYQDGTFRPNQPITRAEAVKILTNFDRYYFYLDDPAQLHKLLGENHPFSDVRPSDWFYDAVYGAYWAKVVAGKSATEFHPHDLLTRAETAVLINRYIGEE